MTTQLEVITTTDTLDAVRELAPVIAARAAETERARRLPPDLVEDLTRAGCFRSLVPRSHGGAELDLGAQMDLIRELARADGSVGWTAMLGSMAPVPLGKLPRDTFDAIYADGPDVIVAGAFNPKGVATPVDGGYMVSGQWSFASGCEHAHWFLAHCIVPDGRMPPIRMMVLPPSDVEIKDTWSVSGLCGTGSHDFVVNDVFVPEGHTLSLFGPSCIDAPVFRIPEVSFATFGIAAVALGIAEAALADILTLATGGKVPAMGFETLAANPLFQHRLGAADAQLRAARALLYDVAATAWATAEANVAFTLEQRARIRATNVWVTEAAAAVVDTAYTAGGGSSIYGDSPLQRRLRDVHAVTQHFAVKSDTYTKAGAVLAGQDVDLTFL